MLLSFFILFCCFPNHNSPGIGQVPSIKLVNPGSNSPLFIEWEKPVFVSTDVTNLMYNVSVSGADPSSLNVTTKDAKCCYGIITPCQGYNITVTPFSTSSNYTGASTGTEDVIDGGTLMLSDVILLTIS